MAAVAVVRGASQPLPEIECAVVITEAVYMARPSWINRHTF
jgi:hypothetical protein